MEENLFWYFITLSIVILTVIDEYISYIISKREKESEST